MVLCIVPHVWCFFLQLNRCDSDSSMPLYSRGPFNRNSLDRKSVRWKKTGVNAVSLKTDFFKILCMMAMLRMVCDNPTY